MTATTGGRPGGRYAAAAAAAGAALLGAAGLLAYLAVGTHGNPYAVAQFVVGATSVAVGGFVAFHRPRQPAGWLLLVAGTGSWSTFAGSSAIDWMFQQSWTTLRQANVVLHLATPGWILTRGVYVALVPLVVPAWRRSRRTVAHAWAAAAAITATAVAHSLATTFGSFQGEAPVGAARAAHHLLPWLHRTVWLCGLVAIVDMARRVASSSVEDRRRHRWVAAALGALLIPTVVALTVDALRLSEVTFVDEFERWTLAAIPVVVAAAILRHGVFDVRVVVRRVTVYLGLAGVAAAVYVAVVALVALVTDGGDVGPEVAAGIVAVTVVPAYSSVQRFATRLVYGRRDDPYDVVTALGARLAQAPPGEHALRLVTTTLREQLRLPFVAVELSLDGAPVCAASSGDPVRAVERFPILHQGSDLGSLVVGCRSEHEPFRPSERALLTDFARQAGVVAHNAALSEALRRSRTILLQAREDERERIRRDLHDGLGPTLATVSLGLGAAADRLEDDPALGLLLRDLEEELREAIGDIRRLVYDLRPPVLDDLGLVDAVRAHARALDERTTEDPQAVRFELEAPEAPVELPAAVELAAYRVALEAMTNVIRHARAARCWVRIEPGATLVVRVEDDGVGLALRGAAGIGLRSMRDRVHELGGSLQVVARHPSGTRVEASFPVREATPA